MVRRLITSVAVAALLTILCVGVLAQYGPPNAPPNMPSGPPPPPPPPPTDYPQYNPNQDQSNQNQPPITPDQQYGGQQGGQQTYQHTPRDYQRSRQNAQQNTQQVGPRNPQSSKPKTTTKSGQSSPDANYLAPKPAEAAPAGENLSPTDLGAGHNWPMYRSDTGHTGTTDERLGFPLKLLWKYIADLTPNNPSSPAVADGVVYFCAGGRLYAVNVETGSLKWRYPAEETLTATIKSSPVIGEDLVYFGAGDGKLYAITKDSGELGWTFVTKGIMSSSPMLADGVIYVGSSDDHLYAVDAATGQLKWGGGFKTRDDVSSSPAVVDGLVYFLSNDMMLYAANALDGKAKWSVRVGNWSAASTPVVTENSVYLATGNMLQVFQAKSGRLKWSLKFSNDISTIPAVASGDVYFATRNGRLYAVTRAGKLKWPAPVELGSAAYGSPIVTEDAVIVGANRGTLAAFDPETGAPKWKYIVQPSALDYGKVRYVNLASSPVVSDGTLYVLADDGALHAFRADAPDSSPPGAVPLTPPRDYLMSGSPPIEIAAYVCDVGSGLQEDSLTMALDGQTVKHQFLPERGIIWYKTEVGQSIRPMADGVHTATVTAKDWAGNSNEVTWCFTVDNRIRKQSKTTAAAPGGGVATGQ